MKSGHKKVVLKNNAFMYIIIYTDIIVNFF